MVVVLAIGAHPDDIELGCSGTLALLKKRSDCKVYYLVLTKGEASGNPNERWEECLKAADILKVDEIFFGGLEDTKIDDDIKTINVIEDVIDKIKPEVVFSHTTMDIHQDHRKAAFATMCAARRIRKVLEYEGPRTTRSFVPQVFVDIETTLKIKSNVTRVFGSQSTKYYLAAEAVEGLARHRGYQCGLRVAEAFEVGRFILGVNEF